MCELFGMSARCPANVRISLRELGRHGGGTGPHGDGWGVAFYAGNDVRLIREPAAAVSSSLLQQVDDEGFESPLVIAHVRLATQGARTLSNTQPFARELGGRMHVFAHNGNLEDIQSVCHLEPGSNQPVGGTDSEHAFCVLLDRLRPLWSSSHGPPSLVDRIEAVREFAALIRPLGPANFLFSDGELLYAHGHRRTQVDRSIGPPGLWMLHRECALPPTALDSPLYQIATSHADHEPQPQVVGLFASIPLTDEGWTPLEEGQVVALRSGAQA